MPIQKARDLDPVLEAILPTVSRPTRYIGGEWNEVVKDHRDVALTFALAFPDVYEIGMSHLGFRILYSLLNARDDTAAERVFCPWPDMADSLRRHRRPLTSLETQTSLGSFDVVGFSLQYEMTFTNVLEMLDLSGIPLRTAARTAEHPLVVVGGPVVFNVEPLADFVDLVFVGDGEEMIPEFLEKLTDLKRSGASRETVLRECGSIEGIYAPSLYGLETDDRSGLQIPTDRGLGPYPVKRRILMDVDAYPFPDRIVVPHGEIVHDRVSVESMRGCPVGCRFCQAGYVYRPTRERDPNQLRDTVIRSVRATGYDQFSLSSLNTGEYGAIQPLMFDLMDRFEPEKVSISLSSMHASTITPELAEQVRRVRKSGFTIAPEAGTQRMRNVINKNLDEEQILTACRLAFEAGWDLIKLYFMIGLPTETDADVDGIADLAGEILALGRRSSSRRKKIEVTLSASSFIPKPETPFQWVGMERLDELARKQRRIAQRVRRGVRFKHHGNETSFIEGAFSRGDRALGNVLERAWRNGARFDGWDEHFDLRIWLEAFRAEGLDPETYAHQDLDPGGPLPWQVVDSRVNRKWLAIELKRAMKEATLTVCGPTDCHGCAPFARDCVKGIITETTGRALHTDLALLSTPAAPGPGTPACSASAPPLVPRKSREALQQEEADRPRFRYRGRFRKSGRLRFLGHLDLSRLMMRAMRRARIPLAYSQGFNPKPRVAFGPALSVGIVSEGEYVDFDSYDGADPELLVAAINDALPEEVRFTALCRIRRDLPALGEAIRAARYRVATGDPAVARGVVEGFHDGPKPVVRRQNKGKEQTFDMGREVLDLEAAPDGEVKLVLALRSNGASIRPGEALHELFGESAARFPIVREDLLVDWNGRMINPLLAASASHAERAVS